MSNNRIRKRNLRWSRYLDHYMGERFLVPPGAIRAYNAWVLSHNRRLWR